MAFDVSMINRVGKEIEDAAKRLQKTVNSPDELTMELAKIESSLRSLESLAGMESYAGANAKTAQYAPNQNQS
jgi:hypothetical protein